MFLVSLGDALGGHGGHVVGINQVVWDPATNTLHAESDELLDQHTRYLLVVTTGVKGADGQPIGRDAFDDFLDDHPRRSRRVGLGLEVYRRRAQGGPGARRRAPATTSRRPASSRPRAPRPCSRRSASRSSRRPAPATIHGTFPLTDLVASSGRAGRTAPRPGRSPHPSLLPILALTTPGERRPSPSGSSSPRTGRRAQGFIPADRHAHRRARSAGHQHAAVQPVPADRARPPAGGWPVAIFGHGFTDSKHGAPCAVGATFAAHGIATIAINVVGHGGGAARHADASSRTVGDPVTIPDGGRGVDQDGNGTIDSTEGVQRGRPARASSATATACARRSPTSCS